MFFFHTPLLGHVVLDVLLVMHATQKKKMPSSPSAFLPLTGFRSTSRKDSTSALSIPAEFFSCHHNPHTDLHTQPILPKMNNIPCPSTNVVQALRTHMPPSAMIDAWLSGYCKVDFCSKNEESFIHNQTRAYLNAETTVYGSAPCTIGH